MTHVGIILIAAGIFYSTSPSLIPFFLIGYGLGVAAYTIFDYLKGRK